MNTPDHDNASLARRVWDHIQDVAAETAHPFKSAPFRSLLLGLGTAVAVALFTYAYTASATEATKLEARLEALSAKTVTVSLPYTSGPYTHLTPEHLQAISELDGVVAVADYRADDAVYYCQSCGMSSGVSSPQYLRTKMITVAGESRALGFSSESLDRSASAYYAGTSGSFRDLRPGQTLTVDGKAVVIAGFSGPSTVEPSAADGIVRFVPSRSVSLAATGGLVVRTEPGLADELAPRIASIVDPVNPKLVAPKFAADSDSLRRDISGAVDRILLLVVLALLVVSAVGVGLAAFAKVVEKVRFLGLLRAIGCSPRVLVLQQCLESAAVGAVAAVVGCTSGLVAAVVAGGGSAYVPTLAVAAGAFGAVIVHILAVIPPAIFATRIPPIDAIRSQ